MKTLTSGHLALCIAVAALFTGCKVPSQSEPTDQIHPQFTVETDADGLSRIDARFLARGKPVTLDVEDELHVWGGFADLRFDGPAGTFQGEAQSGNTANTRFHFWFWRFYWDNAFSDGTLPAPMDLLTPQPGQEYALDDDIVVAWRYIGSDDTMSVRVVADCAGSDDASLDESFTVPVPDDSGLFTFRAADHMAASCERYAVVLTLVRTRNGEIDVAYAEHPDAAFTLSQVRSVHMALRR